MTVVVGAVTDLDVFEAIVEDRVVLVEGSEDDDIEDVEVEP